MSLSPRLEYGGAISVHCNLELLGSNNSSMSASLVARSIGMHHHAGLIFSFFFLEMGVSVCCPDWSHSWPQVILLSRPPKLLGLQV